MAKHGGAAFGLEKQIKAGDAKTSPVEHGAERSGKAIRSWHGEVRSVGAGFGEVKLAR